MATIDSLPDEILSHIMDMLKPPPPMGWDDDGPEVGTLEALRSASLVCSR